MAEIFDAASRLAEGRSAAEIVQEYVWACRLLGYQDPDLTLHAAQVRDWYGTEDGIDLRALDADCEALRAAAAATEGVLARQEVQLVSMAVAWRGPGAQASREFLRRHDQASSAVVNSVRTAAESLAGLRDRLWHSIDGKAAATIAAESRGARPDWRAAAQTVTTGAGDRATASELVDHEVKPFVENDIRTEWLAAMRSAMAAVSDAYDAAVAELTAEATVAFEVPGDLGPTWSAPPSDGAATAPAGVSSVGAGAPTAWSAPPAAQPMSASAPPPVPASPPPPPVAPPVEPAAMPPPSVPSLGGGGLPDIGSGLSGFGGQLGDMLGGLLGTSQDAVSDLSGPADLDEGEEPDELDEDEDEDEDTSDEPDDGEVDEEEGAGDDPAAADAGLPPAGEPPAEAPPAEVEATPTETPAPPPIEPLAVPPVAEPAEAGTPCEIAANELPQVGE